MSMYSITAGQLKTRISVEALTPGKDTSGGVTRTWGAHASVWARVRHYSGNERRATAAGGGQVAEARTEFVLRFRTDITDTMRIKLGGVIYNIRHIAPVDRQWLIINADTGVSNG